MKALYYAVRPFYIQNKINLTKISWFEIFFVFINDQNDKIWECLTILLVRKVVFIGSGQNKNRTVSKPIIVKLVPLSIKKQYIE